MAKFPITTARGSLPGETAKTRYYDTDTAGEAVGRALGSLGESAFDVGMTVYKMQGESELTRIMAEDQDEIQRMLLRFEESTDESTYQSDFEQTYSGIRAKEVKNGWARRQHDLSVTRMRPQIQKVVDQAYLNRVDSNFSAAMANEKVKAINSGNGAIFQKMLSDRVAAGRMTTDQMDMEMQDFRHGSQRRALEALASNDPDAVLDDYTTWDDMKKQYPDMEPSEFSYIRGLAQAQKAANRNRKSARWDGILEDVFKDAHEIDPMVFKSKLLQRDDIEESERAELMETYLKAYKLYDLKGENPWTSTQDHPSLAQTLVGIDDGTITHADEITAAWLKGGTPNWSIQDWQMAKNAFTSKAKPVKSGYTSSHPLAKMYFEKLTSMYMGKDGKIENPREYSEKYMLLEQSFKDQAVWGDGDKMSDAFDGLVKDRKEKQAKGIIRSLIPEWELGGGTLWKGVMAAGKWFVNRPGFEGPEKWKKNREEMLKAEAEKPKETPKKELKIAETGIKKSTEVVTMATPEEARRVYPTLPSGTEYIGPDGIKRKKP